MEVGDEIRNVSVAYGADGGYDDGDSGSGSMNESHLKGDEENMAGVRERKVGGNDF